MRIAIIGTRGIPNHYGGFEQFAEYLSFGLVKKGHEVTVYNSHKHPFKESKWNGVDLVHCFDPEYKIGTAGQFIYDLNCILDARKKKFELILQLGYTSSAVWGWLLPRKSVITTNMDGLEWKRSKFSKPVQRFLLWSSKLCIKYSDHLIADSTGIQQWLLETYQKNSVYIPYGAFPFENPDAAVLTPYHLTPYDYDMLVARLEPENSIEVILDGVAEANNGRKFLVVGKHETSYGNFLKDKFKAYPNICFLGGIYDINILNNIRYFSNLYFHGHTVGGTNPSLLEAMASGALICANNNIFNYSILGKHGLYFKNKEDVTQLLLSAKKTEFETFLAENINKIKTTYSWNTIIEQYEDHFKSILLQGNLI